MDILKRILTPEQIKLEFAFFEEQIRRLVRKNWFVEQPDYGVVAVSRAFSRWDSQMLNAYSNLYNILMRVERATLSEVEMYVQIRLLDESADQAHIHHFTAPTGK